MQPEKARRVRVGSGREVAVHVLQSGESGTVVFCHPTPGAGTLDPDPASTASRDVTLLAVDRAGYGESPPLKRGEARTVVGSADDLASVIETLGVAPVGVAGWSLGGWVAAALAARHPGLVDRLVLLSVPAPHAELPWLPPALSALVAESGAGKDAPRRLARALAAAVQSGGDPLSLLWQAPADAGVVGDGARAARLRAMMEAAFAKGPDAYASELAAFLLQPWEFDPAAIKAKTLLLFGSADPVAGQRHATWWKDAAGGGRIEIVPGGGHYMAPVMWGRTMAHLAPHTKR